MPSVLVVDDSAVDRKLVGGLLEKEPGLQVEFAENGRDALAKIRGSAPDIIVTDLQMPEMDGLDLVRAVSVHHSDIPVILMTAHGSEELAVAALEQGAASYVPKAKIAEKLLDTVHQVLALAHAEGSYERLLECMDRTEFLFTLHNDPAIFDPLIDLVQQIVVGMGVATGGERFSIGSALQEALLNAFYRGNLEISRQQMQEARERMLMGEQLNLVEERLRQPPYADRKITVGVKILKDEARFIVRDEGPGFDVSKLPQPSTLESLDQEEGRGLVLIRTCMDEVRHNANGNEITMVKRRLSDREAAMQDDFEV
ncbi:MAG: response regulator [Planctomycetes bacterium]|nr:response regulator [Planctomycetota bacterium]